jgi:hypothetical protein
MSDAFGVPDAPAAMVPLSKNSVVRPIESTMIYFLAFRSSFGLCLGTVQRKPDLLPVFEFETVNTVPMAPLGTSQKAWMKQTMEQCMIASLQRPISPEDLLEDQWLVFKDKMRDGDELWYFRTPPETWTEFFPRCGMEGYALVRGEKVIAEVFTSMN